MILRQRPDTTSMVSNSSEIMLRDSLRRSSMSFLLLEAGNEPAAEDQDVSDDISPEYASILKSLKQFSVKLFVADDFPETSKLIATAVAVAAKSLVNAEDPKAAETYGKVATFLGSSSYLLASLLSAAKKIGDPATDGNKTLDELFGGDIEKLVKSKFVPTTAWWNRTGKIMKWYHEKESQGAATGRTFEGLHYESGTGLTEAMYGEADRLDEGFLDFIKGFFGKIPDSKTSVKNMFSIFKGDISKALTNDLKKLPLRRLSEIVKANDTLLKQFVTTVPKLPTVVAADIKAGPDKAADAGSGGSGSGGPSGGGGSGSGTGPPPTATPAQTGVVKSASTEIKNDSSGALEKVFSPEVAAKFMDVASGKIKIDSLESPEKEIISAFIANISKSIDKGEKPNVEQAAAAAKKRVVGIDKTEKSEIDKLIKPDGYDSLTDALLKAKPEVLAKLGLNVENRKRTTTLEGSLSSKSMRFLFEDDASDAKAIIEPAIKDHVNDGTSSGEAATKIYDILSNKQSKEKKDSEGKKPFGKTGSNNEFSVGGVNVKTDILKAFDRYAKREKELDSKNPKSEAEKQENKVGKKDAKRDLRQSSQAFLRDKDKTDKFMSWVIQMKDEKGSNLDTIKKNIIESAVSDEAIMQHWHKLAGIENEKD